MKKTLLILLAAFLVVTLSRETGLLELNYNQTNFQSNATSSGGRLVSKDRRISNQTLMEKESRTNQAIIQINWDTTEQLQQKGDTLIFNITQFEMEGALYRPLSKNIQSRIEGNFKYKYYLENMDSLPRLENQTFARSIDFSYDISVELNCKIEGLCSKRNAREILKTKYEEKIIETVKKELIKAA